MALPVTTARRILAYLERSGPGDDLDGPPFRPIVSGLSVRRRLDDRLIDKLVRAYARKLKIRGRHSAHSMQATFITTALGNGASLEEAQAAAGHSSPMTAKLYDKRGYSPERSATHFATY